MIHRFAAAALFFALLAGPLQGECAASEPVPAETSETPPGPEPGHGRIYFYRDNSIFGALMQPDIWLNGEAVGSSTPGSYFFVDRPAGKCIVTVRTEAQNVVEFDLADGQVRYVRTYTSMGFLIGRVYPELIDPEQAKVGLRGLRYTGDPALIAAARKPGAAGSAASPRGSVKMEDLEGLLSPEALGSPEPASENRAMEELNGLIPAEAEKK